MSLFRRGRDRRRAEGVPPFPPVKVVGVHDPEVARTLSVEGYARLGPVIDNAECARLRDTFDEVQRRLGRPLGNSWFPTILLPDPELRRFITEEVNPVVLPRLSAHVDLGMLEPVRFDYSVKPPGPESILGPHQDFSIVDERRWTSLYAWIPLVDTDDVNGTLHVLPRSHRFTNRVRSRHVPSMFDPVLDEVEERSIRLDCGAGELVLMASGVVHFSHPNSSEHVRLAAHGILKPAAAPLLFYYADDETPAGKVEVYEVSIDDYIELAVAGRPGPDVPLVGHCDRPPMEMTPERFQQGLAAVARG